MDKSIGVGLIVGLTFASSVYVWNNEKFNSIQKTILLICVVFPPAQWLGILVVIAYNNYKVNNSIEKVTERKVEQVKINLDNSISSLKDLKDKGILTDEEYETKVAKINAEKDEQSLKSLLDSGILTKEEFESKIKLIQNVSEKEVDIEEINNVINSVNTIYLDNVEDKQQDKKGSSTPIYVFSIIFFIILISGTIIFSNYNEESKSLEDNYTVDTSAIAIENNYKEEVKINKFIYIVMKVEKPKLDVYQPLSTTSISGFSITPDPIYSINYENETYTTEIIEIENYNLDEKYKAIDNAQNKMYSQLEMYDNSNYINSFSICKDDAKREEFKKIASKVVDTQVYEFDSYSEASISKKDDSNIINTK
jgi:hypothetical protein